YIETIPKRGYRFVAAVKVLPDQTESVVPPAIDGDATIIEKHTFTHVISEEVEGTELTVNATPAPAVAEVTALPQPAVAGRRKQQIKGAAAVVTALFLLAAIGVFFYLKHEQVSQVRGTRAKSTLVRLTYNSAQDAAPSWSLDGSKIAFASNRDGKRHL